MEPVEPSLQHGQGPLTRVRAQLYRTAGSRCGDPHRAEDVVQDALARLYRNWPRVTRADNVEGYVRRILVNSHYSDRRRPWRREAASIPVYVIVDPGMAPEDDAAIRTAIRALPPWSAQGHRAAPHLGPLGRGDRSRPRHQPRDGQDADPRRLAALRRVPQSNFLGTPSLQGEER